MNNRSILLTTIAAACLLIACPRPAEAYIDVPPQTLGDLCRQSTHISVVKVEKVSAERGVILFKPVEQLKGKDDSPLPDDTFAKHVIGSNVPGAKAILDGAAEGKTAVVFAKDFGIKSVAHVYLENCWYLMSWNNDGKCWFAWRGEPTMLVRYCGPADRLPDAVTKILKGEEVVVPGMAADDPKALAERRGNVLDVRASLKILGNPKQNLEADLKAALADEKKPGAKPDGTKPVTPEKPGAKPEPGEKPDLKPSLVGIVKVVAAGGKSFTLLLPPTDKTKEPVPVEIQLTDRTKVIVNDGAKLASGQAVSVWLEKGDAKTAAAIQIGKPAEKPTPKPEPLKPGKPNPDDKPEAPRKPRVPTGPVRDPAPTATVIDTELDKLLAKAKITAPAQADDAEFLRRVTLDLTGRIPTYAQTVAFLDSKDPDKRRKLIDELLDSPAYGEHFATIWRNLILGRDRGLMEKGRGDTLRPWLVDQFNDNRAWNALVADFLTAEGTPNDNPATAFLLANGEQGQPQPNKIAGSVASLFWGINLRCAECHDHPFTRWKQTDFWGTAAFFGKVQFGGAKGGPMSLTEVLPANTTATKVKGQPTFAMRGTAIAVPTGSGKASGQFVKARFLGGDEAVLKEDEPFRPRFAAWATAADNPFFAKAAANRMWAHFFGRSFTGPPDCADETNPELLDKLAKEFAASGFDLKHLARCITTSTAYQRTSRPAGDKPDPAVFSHMSAKVLTPEAFYDSVSVVMRGSTEKNETRDQFLRDFRFDDYAPATQYIQGIPQLLRLMNGSLLNRSAPVVDRLVSANASHTEAITTLYLTVLSRRPTDDEVKVMESYLSKRKDDREGYRGVLWILLNTSEFALNH